MKLNYFLSILKGHKMKTFEELPTGASFLCVTNVNGVGIITVDKDTESLTLYSKLPETLQEPDNKDNLVNCIEKETNRFVFFTDNTLVVQIK